MTKKPAKEETPDKPQSRVDKTHGGEIVEAIAPEDLVSVNDTDCKHENLVRDASETEFNAFMCANPNCGVVVLYDKQ
jgi:hypothetical protein